MWQRGLILSALALAAAARVALAASPANPTSPTPASHPDAPITRWEQLRFGAFLHYSINTYGPTDGAFDDLYRGDCRNADLFAPTALDVAGWIRGFKEAGMRYAVLTTRHAGGFLLWDSATSNYSSMHSASVRRDLVAEFVAECRKQGLAAGFYYLMGGGQHDSLSCPINGRKFGKADVLAQLTELATHYGPIPYFWIDMMDLRPIRALGDDDDVTTQEIYDLIKRYQPEAIVHFNQHMQDGSRIDYFPTDVVNGEETIPRPDGYDPARNRLGREPRDAYERGTFDNAGYEPEKYYLPFEYSMTGQIAPGGRRTTPLGSFHNTFWFTRSVTHSESARNIYVTAHEAFARGAANLLLASAPDQSGSLRGEDVAELKILGNLIDARADLGIERGSLVSRVQSLGALTKDVAEARCRLTTGDHALLVTKLARFHAFGSTETHRLELRTQNGRILGETTLDTAAARTDLNGFQYARLATPVRLEPRRVYELVSSETAGSDASYAGTRLRTDASATLRDCDGPLNLAFTVDSEQAEATAGHWQLGGAASEAAPDTIADASTHGNIATLHGATRTPEGVSFDGTQSYLSIENSGSLDLSGRISISARFRAGRVDGVRNIVAHGYTRAPAREVFLRIHDGRYEVGTVDGERTVLAAFPIPVDDKGRWVDLVGAFDGTSWSLRRDGRVVATANDTGAGGAARVPADWAIGGCSRGLCAGDETRGFDGVISDVSIRP